MLGFEVFAVVGCGLALGLVGMCVPLALLAAGVKSWI